MSNPTSNFNWQMPTSSDLVTDLPADFEVFGQAVDTSLADLKGGTTGQILSKATNADMDFTWITNDQGDITAVTAGTGITGGGTSGAVTITNDMATTITTNGDLIYGTGSGTYTRRGIGSTGQVLTVSGGVPTWATASGGGLTWSLKSTTTLSGATSRTVSSLSSKAYMIYFAGMSADTSSDFDITFNSDTGANYNFAYFVTQPQATYNRGIVSGASQYQSSRIRLGSLGDVSSGTMSGGLTIMNADAAGFKPFTSAVGVNAQSGSDAFSKIGQGMYLGTSAITSITLTATVGNLDAGTMYIYGGD